MNKKEVIFNQLQLEKSWGRKLICSHLCHMLIFGPLSYCLVNGIHHTIGPVLVMFPELWYRKCDLGPKQGGEGVSQTKTK